MNKLLQTLRDKADLYKPKPFLTLNDTICEESLRKLIRTMAEHGLGGFYAHARSGLTAPYLSEEWFRIIDICADECEKTGLRFWIYDEMGWPSGSAGGQVTAKNADYASRWLKRYDSRRIIALAPAARGIRNDITQIRDTVSDLPIGDRFQILHGSTVPDAGVTFGRVLFFSELFADRGDLARRERVFADIASQPIHARILHEGIDGEYIAAG